MDQLKIEMLKCLETLLDDEKSLLVHASTPIAGMHVSKDTEKSEETRNEGNRLFRQSSHASHTHHRILHLYNESIAYAPNESQELASAYGNKSAILRHLRKYAESVVEADKAIKITKSVSLKVKLLCRKAECYTAMGSPENASCLEEARSFLAKESPPEELKNSLQDLIVKTQLVVDAGKLDTPKILRHRMLTDELIADAQKKDLWDSVQLEYCERYGWHFVAARDFEPAEIITVEESLLTRLLDSRIFSYCFHCFDYLWTVVPCEQCAFRLYCSEKCKDEAWNQHHDMECNVLVKMKESALLNSYQETPLVISFFFKALKEAGSIVQLQKELEVLDRRDVDERSREFPPDGKFTSYKSMYLLRCRPFLQTEYNLVIKSAAIALLGIAKYTDILGTRYDLKDINKLRENDTAIFVGAFLFKFTRVIFTKITLVQLLDPSEPDIQQMIKPPPCKSFQSLEHLFPPVCVPNCKSSSTYGAKHVMFAMQPIKKGTPLTSSKASIYDFDKKPKRLAIIKALYDSTCDCRACTEDWFEAEPADDQIYEEIAAKFDIGNDCLREAEKVERDLSSKSLLENVLDTNLLTRTKNMVAIAWENFSMPSTVLLRTTSVMMEVYHMFLNQYLLHSPPCERGVQCPSILDDLDRRCAWPKPAGLSG